jgi:hypothetical protein
MAQPMHQLPINELGVSWAGNIATVPKGRCAMPANDSWIYQGRDEKGRFGDDLAPEQ